MLDAQVDHSAAKTKINPADRFGLLTLNEPKRDFLRVFALRAFTSHLCIFIENWGN